MGADLGHQEHLFEASVPERPAQDGLRLAVVILPGVVEESNAGVYRLVDELDRLVQRRYIAEMMNTHPNRGNLRPGVSESPIDHIARSPGRCPRPDSIRAETCFAFAACVSCSRTGGRVQPRNERRLTVRGRKV